MPGDITPEQTGGCPVDTNPGIAIAYVIARQHPTCGMKDMDLTMWIPAMVALGLVTLGLMFLFVIACDKV